MTPSASPELLTKIATILQAANEPSTLDRPLRDLLPLLNDAEVQRWLDQMDRAHCLSWCVVERFIAGRHD